MPHGPYQMYVRSSSDEANAVIVFSPPRVAGGRLGVYHAVLGEPSLGFPLTEPMGHAATSDRR